MVSASNPTAELTKAERPADPERIKAGAAGHHVLPDPAVQDVVALAAEHGVGADAAEELVVAGAAVQEVRSLGGRAETQV